MSENTTEQIINPKVSIIIPCYNQGKYVAAAIQSALDQTYDNIEIVVVNDGSTDNSSDVIQRYVKKNRNILFLDNKVNRGVINARNMAIDASSGEYILPLDADDIIEPLYAEMATNILKTRADIGIVYCNARIFGTQIGEWKLPEYSKETILFENCIFNSAFFRKKDFISVGGYKDYMSVGCEDYDLWLSFIEQGWDVYKINKVLFNYRKYKEYSRTDLCAEYNTEVWKQIIKNHINLYINNKLFLESLSFTGTLKTHQKYKKYKKLFNIFLLILIIETIILFLILFIIS